MPRDTVVVFVVETETQRVHSTLDEDEANGFAERYDAFHPEAPCRVRRLLLSAPVTSLN